MVGTKPTVWPWLRQPRTAARRAWISVTVCMRGCPFGSVLVFGRRGNAPLAHVVGVGGHGRDHRAATGEEILAELGPLARRDAEHVVTAPAPGRRCPRRRRCRWSESPAPSVIRARQRRPARLSTSRSAPAAATARASARIRSGDLCLAALHAVAAQPVHRLRRQAQVRADRHVALDQCLDDAAHVAGALQLDHRRAALGHQPRARLPARARDRGRS